MLFDFLHENCNCGIHIAKDKTLLKTLTDFYENIENKKKPVQIFTGSPKFWKKPNPNIKDIINTNDFIKKNNLSVYIHSIYLINLANSLEDFIEKAYPSLKYELQIGYQFGAKGVVVHTGKHLKEDIKTSIDKMYENIMYIYNQNIIQKENPLLIETASGQGTELLCKLEDLHEFYNRFTDTEKEYIKICIDTCHVFAFGYEPFEFIKTWDTLNSGSIHLIHLNDSKEDKGKRKDRHEYPGKGYIGMEQLNKIIEWCDERDIPMIIEN